MKNFIMKIIFLSILALNPSYFTNSSTLINDDEYSINEMKKLSYKIYKLTIIDKINNEYDIFYDNLYKSDEEISENKHIKNIEFINKISCHALESKSLPSIAIAQAILETGYGKSNKLKNNIFGIKGKGIKSKTKEYVNNDFITIKSEFQKFNDLNDAFNRHYDIIGKYGFNNRNYKEWAKRIKNCGYATDPDYAKKLIYLIEKHELYRLDRIQELNIYLNNLTNKEYVGIS